MGKMDSIDSNTNYNRKMAEMIDHTLLKPDASDEEHIRLCQEAIRFNFATCCVYSSKISLISKHLKGSKVKPIAVIDFPLGTGATDLKVSEAEEAIENGAQEIDMVININYLKSKDYGKVFSDIKQVVDASKPYPVKVIIETCKLNQEEKIIACALSKAADAAFVKTSTGFGGGGATVEDVKLMRRIVGDNMGVKASGGIKTAEDANSMIQAGANRIGSSSSVKLVIED